MQNPFYYNMINHYPKQKSRSPGWEREVSLLLGGRLVKLLYGCHVRGLNGVVGPGRLHDGNLAGVA